MDGEYFISFKREITIIPYYDKVPDVNYDYYISIYSKQYKESLIDKFKDISNWVLKLFNFLRQTGGEYLYFKFFNEYEVNCRRVEKLGDGIRKYQGRLVFPQISIPKSGSVYDELKLTDIVDDFESIISKWFDNKEKLKYIIDLYGQNSSPNMAVELVLINKIRMLETYFDNFTDIIWVINEDGNKIEELKENIKSESEIKGKTYGQLEKHNKEKNFLVNKLASMLNNIPDNLKNIFSMVNKDWEKEEFFIDNFAEKLKETRNFYTHTANEKKNINRLKTMGELIVANQILDYVIYYWVLKVLLDDDNKILDLPFFRRVKKYKKL